jgi:hypothetical protein
LHRRRLHARLRRRAELLVQRRDVHGDAVRSLARAAVAFVPACCTSPTDGRFVGAVLAGGTGTVAIDSDRPVPATQLFVGDLDSDPTQLGVGVAYFTFAFIDDTSADSAWLAFTDIKWSMLTDTSSAISLAPLVPKLSIEFRNRDSSSCDASFTLDVGTITPTPQLDRHGNGTIALQLDVPAFTKSALDCNDVSRNITIVATALVAVMRFEPKCTT